MKVLQAKNIHLGYPRKSGLKKVISDLSFELKPNQLTCLLGRNGIGKSTLIKGLLGQLAPSSGEIFLGERDLLELSKEEIAKEIAVVLTEYAMPGNLTVEQLVALGRTPHLKWHGRLSEKDYEAVEKALELTKILDLRKERISELSDGQRQKAMIARALAQESQILILDEPTAHLDLLGRHEIMALLQELAMKEGRAILVVTHNIELAIESAQEFWLLIDQNEMLLGTPEDLIIAGKIKSLIPGETFKFDLEKGKIVFPSENLDLNVSGPENLKFWVEKALEKAQIKKLEQTIEIESKPFSLHYGGQSFDSIKALIDQIKS